MMLSKLFTWPYHGQDALALRDYEEDEQALMAVTQFFQSINGTALTLFFISIIFPVIICCLYHFWFCNKPGRHYRPLFQVLSFVFASVITLIISWIFESIMVSLPPIDNNFGVFLFDVSLGAMCFGMLVYILTALILGLSRQTNAYPLHKIFSKR